jgi:type II secretory pathway pseudopilin PulG
MKTQSFDNQTGQSFTLVELLVVIAVIALLLAILMPSLNKARQSAYAVKCAGNMHNIGMQSYVNESGYYPPSYIYPKDADGGYTLDRQPEDHPFGYLHWSWFLFDSGRCDQSAFTCPAMDNGGAPRTNPGLRHQDWQGGQVDQNGGTESNSLTDKQAARMAYTGNAAVICRNKFPGMTAMQRYNRLVKPTEISRPGDVILLTEFNRNWKALGVGQGDGVLSKSHRPITPFSHTSTGYQGYAVFNAPVEQATDLLDGGVGHPLNAAGEPMGGTTSFLYCDSHVERKTVEETLNKLEWGKQFYSITGVNLVRY